MKIEINSKNYNVSEKLREIITKKIERLDRYFFDDASAYVLCKYENEQYKMEITIRDRRTTFRSEVSGDNMYENIDHALPKVERQIYKNKDKLKDRIRANSFDTKEFLFLADEPKVQPSKISRKKTFELEPIDIEEAILALDSTDHDFYVFLNAETNKVNVLYKRNNNRDFGQIELDY